MIGFKSITFLNLSICFVISLSYHACKCTCKKKTYWIFKSRVWHENQFFYFRWWDVEWVSKRHHPQVRRAGKSLWYVEKSYANHFITILLLLLKKKEHNGGFFFLLSWMLFNVIFVMWFTVQYHIFTFANNFPYMNL